MARNAIICCVLMKFFSRLAHVLCIVSTLVLCHSTSANDLDAASDGEHLWLVIDDPEAQDEPGLLIYHHHIETLRGLTNKLEPKTGQLMPGGIAAGDGKLLLIHDDRSIELVRPIWSKLLLRWEYDRRPLTALPEGCALLSVALGKQGPWALVRVDSPELLDKLEGVNKKEDTTDFDKAALNRALGFPYEFDLDLIDGAKSNDKEEQPEQEEPGAYKPEAEGSEADRSEAEPGDNDKPESDSESDTETEQPDTEPETDSIGDSQNIPELNEKPSVPVYRLLQLRGSNWVSSPLPEDFRQPRHAVIVMRDGDDRPMLIVEPEDVRSAGGLTRYIPFKPIVENENAPADADPSATPAPAWETVSIPWRPYPGNLWSAVVVGRQAVLAVERLRSPEQIVVQLSRFRGDRLIGLGEISVPTRDSGRWSALPWDAGVAVAAVPGPKLVQTKTSDAASALTVAGLSAITLEGEPVLVDGQDQPVIVLQEAKPSSVDENADLFIQIAAFVVAMVLILVYYRKAPRQNQIDLPEHVVFAGLGRRFFAGVIDLLPGFWLAGLLYGTTLNETMLYWPGNGVPKVLPAMRPGFLVIGVTVAHTALAEFATARSLGKWVTGLYVLDPQGKPAKPMASLVRSVARVFDLFVPLMLIVIFITPARQRLGDILARSVVVMRKPPEPPQDETQDGND